MLWRVENKHFKQLSATFYFNFNYTPFYFSVRHLDETNIILLLLTL